MNLSQDPAYINRRLKMPHYGSFGFAVAIGRGGGRRRVLPAGNQHI